jgi:hypothetical protein
LAADGIDIQIDEPQVLRRQRLPFRDETVLVCVDKF